MAKGWITIEREITDHWIWTKEPFTKGQAWLDLLLHANHKSTEIMVKNKVVRLKRGEQARSELTLSDDWRWSRGKVRRFLKLLQDENMIVQQTTHHTSIISICNYNKYQDRGGRGGTAGGTTGETEMTPKRSPANRKSIQRNSSHSVQHKTPLQPTEIVDSRESSIQNGTTENAGGSTTVGTTLGTTVGTTLGTQRNNVNNINNSLSHTGKNISIDEAGWVMGEDQFAELLSIRPDLGEQAEVIAMNFIDHYKSTGDRRCDWDAMWRKWLRDERKTD